MERKFKIIIFSLLIVLVVITFTGVSITAEFEKSGCIAKYDRYIIPNILCQMITMGHCDNTELNLDNAKKEVAHCLCDKYLSLPSTELENSIKELCKEFNSPRLCEYEFNRYRTIDDICENKDDIFGKTFIK